MKRCVKCFGECEDVFEVCPFCGSSMGCPAADGMHLSPGTVLKQRYFIGFAAGAGGFGILYRAFDTILRRTVAVKEFFPAGLTERDVDGSTAAAADSCREPEFEIRKKQFIKEAQFLSGFAGARSVPEIYDYFEENGTAYYVMEYLQGKTLAEGGRIAPSDAAFAVYAVAGAAAAAALLHRKNMVHRDIAPDNLFVCAGKGRPRIVLLDFGAVERIGERKNADDRILKSGFSAPELYRGARADKTADVYALGCTLFALLCGETPLRADIRSEYNGALSAASAETAIPPKLRRILRKATDLSPQKRYRDADAFLSALTKAFPEAREAEKALRAGKAPESGKKPAADSPVADLTERRGITEATPRRLLPGTVLRGRYNIGLDFCRRGVLYRYHGTDRVLRKPVYICEFFPQSFCDRGADGVHVEKKGPYGAFSDRLALFRKTAEESVGGQCGETAAFFTDVFEENGTLYLIAPDNGALPLAESDRFLRGKKYSRRGVRALLSPIAADLLSCGEKAVHGNLTPDSVCTDGKRVILRDPAALCYPAFGGEVRRERTAYTAPEQEDSGKNLLQGDCYALGALAYRLLSGEEPMPGKERQALKISTGRDPLPPVRERVRIPKALAAGIDAALNLQPEGREKILEVLCR